MKKSAYVIRYEKLQTINQISRIVKKMSSGVGIDRIRDETLRNVDMWEKIGYEQKIQLSIGGTTTSVAGVRAHLLPVTPRAIVGYYDGPLVDSRTVKVHAIGSVVRSNNVSTTIRIRKTWRSDIAPDHKVMTIKNHLILLPTQSITDLLRQ